MSKNKKAIEKRRQKKAARAKVKAKAAHPQRVSIRKDRRVAAAIRKSKVLQAATLLKDGIPVSDISDEDYVFWLCHGANFIASSEEDGIWTPLFEGIYGGKVPEPEKVAQVVMNHYAEQIESEDPLGGVPRSVLAWTLSAKNVVRIYKFEAERRLRETNTECDAVGLARQPHNPVVWGMMAEIKKRTLQAENHEQT